MSTTRELNGDMPPSIFQSVARVRSPVTIFQ